MDFLWRVRRGCGTVIDYPPWRRARWRWQRCRRGWSDRDVWNLHGYLAQVIAGSVTHLRDHGHSYPAGSGVNGEADWAAILTSIAEPLALEWDRDIGGETDEQYITRRNQEHQDRVTAMHLLAHWFHDLWD